MRILVTAGPTREYIDTVRFISNASSGRMGVAVATAAVRAGHDATLLAGQGVAVRDNPGFNVHRFTSVADLKALLVERFPACDALVMAAAVGDFRPQKPLPAKLHRKGGPITLKLFPTEDVLAGLRASKRPGQRIVAFAVEDGPCDQIEAKARAEMAEKGADWVVVNTPAAIAADESRACILAPDAVALPWDDRAKRELADQIVQLLSGP